MIVNNVELTQLTHDGVIVNSWIHDGIEVFSGDKDVVLVEERRIAKIGFTNGVGKTENVARTSGWENQGYILPENYISTYSSDSDWFNIKEGGTIAYNVTVNKITSEPYWDRSFTPTESAITWTAYISTEYDDGTTENIPMTANSNQTTNPFTKSGRARIHVEYRANTNRSWYSIYDTRYLCRSGFYVEVQINNAKYNKA